VAVDRRTRVNTFTPAASLTSGGDGQVTLLCENVRTGHNNKIEQNVLTFRIACMKPIRLFAKLDRGDDDTAMLEFSAGANALEELKRALAAKFGLESVGQVSLSAPAPVNQVVLSADADVYLLHNDDALIADVKPESSSAFVIAVGIVIGAVVTIAAIVTVTQTAKNLKTLLHVQCESMTSSSTVFHAIVCQKSLFLTAEFKQKTKKKEKNQKKNQESMKRAAQFLLVALVAFGVWSALLLEAVPSVHLTDDVLFIVKAVCSLLKTSPFLLTHVSQSLHSIC
jgi:hypothetical protein